MAEGGQGRLKRKGTCCTSSLLVQQKQKSHCAPYKKNNRAGKTARWMVKGEGGRMAGRRCDCGILEIPALVIWGFEVPFSMGGHCEGGGGTLRSTRARQMIKTSTLGDCRMAQF